MRCPARFIAATALAAVSLVPLSVASRADGAQPSLPSALASFLAEEAHATPSGASRRCWQAIRSSSCSMPIPPRRLRCSAPCG